MSEWTKETKKQAIDSYKEQNPTPETSTEIVAKIAETIGTTVNGVRAILVRDGCYVKKEGATSAAGASKTTSTRVNKGDAIAKLDKLIEDNNLTLESDITSKLTGKAALYFSGIFEELTTKEA